MRICVIGARGGSEGLPDKNVRELLGKPLIVWSIEQARSSGLFDRVIVSTDSKEIAKVSATAGAEIPFVRPASLSDSKAGKFGVWKHALDACELHFGEVYDTYVDLDCTNPLRDVSDIQAAVRQFESVRLDGVDAVFSVCDARKNPYFNLVEPNEDGNLQMCKRSDDTVIRRQDAPTVYEHVASIYVLASDYIKRANHLLDGRTRGYIIGVDKSFDIDSELDFRIVENLMKHKYGV